MGQPENGISGDSPSGHGASDCECLWRKILPVIHMGLTGYSEHELAHEWFGNLMTHEKLNDAWLHEGFGLYMQPAYALDKLDLPLTTIRCIKLIWDCLIVILWCAMG